jgi:hypothetical protein
MRNVKRTDKQHRLVVELLRGVITEQVREARTPADWVEVERLKVLLACRLREADACPRS